MPGCSTKRRWRASRSTMSTARAGTNDDGGHCRGGGRLDRRDADSSGLFAAFGRKIHGTIARVSMDERVRRGGLRHQRLVAWRSAVGGCECHLGDHRGSGFMADQVKAELVDLSHVIEEGMVTYKGLPGPHICDCWERAGTAANYDDGSTFQIGRIDMVANTGTYLDSPFHRYADGKDLAGLSLESLADLPGLIVRRPFAQGLVTDADDLAGLDVRGKAVLVHTGWDRHWRTDDYFGDHPYLTAAAADWLAENGAALVGIDSCNIDNMHVRVRP